MQEGLTQRWGIVAACLAFVAGAVAAGSSTRSSAQNGVDFTSQPPDQRVVAGATGVVFEYDLFEFDGVFQSNFDLDASLGGGPAIDELIYKFGANVVQTPNASLNGLGLFANIPADLIVRPDFTGLTAGTTADLVIDLTDRRTGSDPGTGWSNSATTSFGVVDNRALTGSATIDAGRHMVGQTIGTLVVGGGSGAAGQQANVTDVLVNPGEIGTVGRIRVESDAAFTFNAPDQTYSFDVVSRTPGDLTLAADGNAFLNDFSFSSSGNFSPGLVSSEDIIGANLDLAGVTLNVTGEALADRSIGGDVRSLGRFMVGSTPPPAAAPPATDTFTLTTSGDDDARTRVTAAAQNVGSPSDVQAITAGGTFMDGGDELDVTVNAGFAIDTATRGRVDKTVAVALQGEGLTGENPQTAASVGYTYNVVERNVVGAGNRSLVALKNANVSDAAAAGGFAQFGTDEYTDIGIVNNTFVSTSQASNIGSSGFVSSATASATPEGLDGEFADGGSYNTANYTVTTRVLNRPDLELELNGNDASDLAVGDSFSFTNKLRQAGKQQASVNNLSGFGGTVLTLDATGDLDAGNTRTYTVVFDADELDAFDFGRRYRQTFDFDFLPTLAGSSTTQVIGASDQIQSFSFTAEEVFDRFADLGISELDAGFDFFGNELTLTADGEVSAGGVPLALALLDSEALASARTVEARFRARGNLDA